MVGRTDAPLGYPRTRCPRAPEGDRRGPEASSGGPGYPLRVIPGSIRRAAPMTLVLALVMLISACSSAAPSSFDPTGPCTGDGRVPGAYPDLESLVPTIYEGVGPGTLDSGRSCSAENLGPLAADGIEELRFAGGTWSFGAERSAALAVFTAPGLTADMLIELYESGAEGANRTEILDRSAPTLAGRPGHRLDTKTGERLQTVMVWPAAQPDRVNVVLSNDLPDPKIQAAVDAFGGG